MKYVIFKRKSLLLPVIIPEHCTHSEVKIEGFTPIYAGFCSVRSGIVEVDLEHGSESLGLKPGIRDAVLLTGLLCELTGSFYLDYDDLDANQ